MNAASDRFLLAIERGGVAPDLDPLLAEVRRLGQELTACEKKCAGFGMKAKVAAAAGAAVAVAVVAGGSGGGKPPAVANAPAAPPASNTPAPIPAAPAPPPTATGTWQTSSCRVVSDPAFHDLVLALCRVLNFFTLTQGSITIAHASPFVTIAGDYNTTNGVFTATGRGTVAGFPNVGVRGEGTINASTGQAQFNYTLGTAGELPGGQPITYEIVLRKQ